MRHLYLGDLASWTLGIGADETALSGLAGKRALTIPGGVVTFWTAMTGGSQITDLTDLLGNPITQVTADSSGELPQIYGPDTTPDTWYMYADGGSGARRIVAATDLGDVVNANKQSLLDVISDVATLQDQVASSLGVVEYDTTTSSWPLRPTDSRVYMWIGSTAPPIGGGYAQAGRDIWFNGNPVA